MRVILLSLASALAGVTAGGIAVLSCSGDEGDQAAATCTCPTTTGGEGGEGKGGSGGETGKGGEGGETSSGGGGGGGGGEGGTGGAATGGAGGTGGSPPIECDGDCCQKGCEKVKTECGYGDVCQQALSLDCSKPINDCPGKCLLTATCEQVATFFGPNPDPALMGCFQACGAPLDGGVPDGGNALACGNCAGMKCENEGSACFQDSDCQSWFNCVFNCPDAACASGCNDQFPEIAEKYDPVWECLCNKCVDKCDAFDPCGQAK